MELIAKQAGLQNINLGIDEHNNNAFSDIATQMIMTKIADMPSTSINLTALNLAVSNFSSDETVHKLAEIL